MKAKQLVFSVAATTMKKSLQILIKYEMNKGFIAWSIFLRQVRRKEKAMVFIRYLMIRNVVLGFNQLLRKVIIYIYIYIYVIYVM